MVATIKTLLRFFIDSVHLFSCKIGNLRLAILGYSCKVLLIADVDNSLLTFANFIFPQIQMQL
jgi:hypothetical protein